MPAVADVERATAVSLIGWTWLVFAMPTGFVAEIGICAVLGGALAG